MHTPARNEDPALGHTHASKSRGKLATSISLPICLNGRTEPWEKSEGLPTCKLCTRNAARVKRSGAEPDMAPLSLPVPSQKSLPKPPPPSCSPGSHRDWHFAKTQGYRPGGGVLIQPPPLCGKRWKEISLFFSKYRAVWTFSLLPPSLS